MKRELANKMYTPTSYFMGRFVSNLLLQIVFPIMMFMILYLGLGVQESFDNFCLMVIIAILTNFVFIGQGYLFGLAFSNEDAVKSWNVLAILMISGSNGLTVNTKNANWFVKFLTAISPGRFCCEAFFHTMINQVPNEHEGPFSIS